jgi:hypothetical protein
LTNPFCFCLESEIEVADNTKWLKANVNADGYYIVNYDNETWTQLQQQLKQNHSVGLIP